MSLPSIEEQQRRHFLCSFSFSLKLSLLCLGHIVRSSQLLEADLLGLLSESSSAHVKAVLSDETLLVVADSAAAGVLAVLSGVRELLVGHFVYVFLSTDVFVVVVSVCFQDLLFINN